jgi:hypothetical protein
MRRVLDGIATDPSPVCLMSKVTYILAPENPKSKLRANSHTVLSKFLKTLFIGNQLMGRGLPGSGRSLPQSESRVLGEDVGVVSGANGDSTASRDLRPFPLSGLWMLRSTPPACGRSSPALW